MSKSQNKKTNSGKTRWVVGVHSCLEVFQVRPSAIVEIAFDDLDKSQSDTWKSVLGKSRVRPQQRKMSFFKQLSEFGHQGVAVGVSETPQLEDDPDGLVVFLDQLNDPQNLGAILRTAWLMGAQALYIPEHSSVKLNATACKVAAGGAEHVPIERAHFASQMKYLKDLGYWVYGFSDEAKTSLYQAQFDKKTVLIMGSEGRGIRKSSENLCDHQMYIPQTSKGASYNVSVASGIAMSEYLRQTSISHSGEEGE